MNADQLPTTRKSILETLKREGKAAIADLAGRLGMSGEAVRQQLLQLQREGWVEAIRDEAHEKRSGRPAAHYRLTTAGDHLFPKNYDQLGIALLDAVAGHLGPDALSRVLAGMTEARVKLWEQRSNRGLLQDAMVAAGFAPFYGEWWHFSYGDREWAAFYYRPAALYGPV